MRAFLLPAAAILLSSACASVFAPPASHWPPLPDGYFMHAGGYLQVSGTGKPDPAALTDTQRKSSSRDAAIADAREHLRAYLEALPDRRETGREALDRLVRSAEIISTRWTEDGTAAAVLHVEKSRINEALGTSYE